MIVPVLHRILIRQDKLEEADKSYARMKKLDLILPENEDRKRAQVGVDRGTVIAIGTTAFKDFGTSSPIKVGDKVAYARFSGKIIPDPQTEEEFVALNDEDIIAVLISE
jgi:co-chaperonin GroES (HSP10)